MVNCKPTWQFQTLLNDEGIRSCLKSLHRKPVHCRWLKKSASCDPTSRLLRDVAAALAEAVATAELAALADHVVAAAVADATDLQNVRRKLTDRKPVSFRSVFCVCNFELNTCPVGLSFLILIFSQIRHNIHKRRLALQPGKLEPVP